MGGTQSKDVAQAGRFGAITEGEGDLAARRGPQRGLRRTPGPSP